ncbi:MAG: ABC transporter substrate-binding protein [Desulfovibrio sp.]|nr:ABC transporter substrate-binding protein [Desulfovibrio sp.]MBI4957869.1 ABC transporter substrate-binding protein [Desulfovibrio sp.]
MKRSLFALTVLFAVLITACGFSIAADKFPMRISGQPCLHGLPTWQAIEDKSAANSPLDLKYLLFASGAPQVEALAANEWDAGAIGTIPTMMASLRYGALLIGISNDESETNDLWVRPDSPLLKTAGANPKYPEIMGTTEDWKGKRILATTVSTGHYALTSTLKALGLKDSDVKIVHMEQGQAMAAFGAGEGDIIQLWAPSSYVAEAKGWKKVSSGRRAGVMVPGGIIVRKEFAEKNPDKVVEWLDIYMRGIEQMKSEPQQSERALSKYFNDYCGLEMTPEQVGKEFKLRPLFNVTEQIELLTNPDKAPKWMKDIAQFMVDQGRISQAEYDRYVKANCFIDPKFMKMLAEKRAAKK